MATNLHNSDSPGLIWTSRESSTDRMSPQDWGAEWWNSYVSRLPRHALRIRHLEQSSRDIASHIPHPTSWGDQASPYRGLVVGAIQSGKTESMIGVSAVALDMGYRAIIVLTGSKEDLRRQTALRFNTLLLGQSDRRPGLNTYTLASQGRGPLGGFAPPYHLDAQFNLTLPTLIDKHLSAGEPVVIVVKKEKTNLESIGGALRSANLVGRGEPLPLLVLDDECDEGSVGAAGSTDPIPRTIEQIWRNSPELRVAYIGYTATAAANLLQNPDNPLFPSEFGYLIRYPQNSDGPLTFEQPEFDNWYTGGDLFYRNFGVEPGEDANFLLRTDVTAQEANSPDDNQSIYDALIAYFVGGAYRLALQGDRSFDNASKLPDPHSMLIQVSESNRDHVCWRDAITVLLGGEEQSDKTVAFSPARLLASLESDENRWKQWFYNFDRSRSIVHSELPRQAGYTAISWDGVVDRLQEVFANTRLKIVNSDDAEGTDLSFDPSWSSTGLVPPKDIYVIVIGGQKLSRGITIPGLCISYYGRGAHRPYADTTLQLSRWFGYRGQYIEFCRLFTTESTHRLLLDINENDQDYRTRLATIGDRYETLDEALLALRECPTYSLTAKRGEHARTYPLTFSPETKLFTRVETETLSEMSESWASALVLRIKSHGHKIIFHPDGREKGIFSPKWTVEEIADILDGITLTNHNPNTNAYPNPELYKRSDDNRPFNRLLDTRNDPYVVAAYLKHWGLSKRYAAPEFNIVVPYGDYTESNDPFDFPLLNRAISTGSELMDSWTGQSRQRVDGPYLDEPPDELIDRVGHRKSGCRGLLALYVIHKDANGSGSGIRRLFHTPAIGIAIPDGGPSLQVVTNYEINT